MLFRRAAAFVVVGALSWASAVPGVARADAITDKKRKASQLVDRIDALNTKAEILAEQYDKATVDLANLDLSIKQAEAQLAQKRAEISLAQSQMSSWALRTYIHGGLSDPLFGVLNGAGVAGDAALRQGYLDLAVGRDQRSSDELRRSRLDAEAVQADLAVKHRDQTRLNAVLVATRRQVEKATSDAQHLLDRAESDLRALVAAEQARRAAAAEAAARSRIGLITRVSHPPPPPSPGASGAVAAALSQVGVPYRWGGETADSGFDCSGLTAWAWARAGRPGLPHNAYAQWSSLPHVNIEDLRPGDLVFFGSDVHHVGLYIGNGMMVHAPHTGALIQRASIYRSDLIGAARV